jgi:hypothetical protein
LRVRVETAKRVSGDERFWDHKDVWTHRRPSCSAMRV